MTPFRLVRLSAEELLSKEMSEWRKPDAPDVNAAKTKHQELGVEMGCRKLTVYDCFWQERGSSSRAHSGQSKQSSRHSGTHSMDVDDVPPASDADVCIAAASSSARRASAPVSGCKLLSKLSHCFHLFLGPLLDQFDKCIGIFLTFFSPSPLILCASGLKKVI